jgi:hypothetical protein
MSEIKTVSKLIRLVQEGKSVDDVASMVIASTMSPRRKRIQEEEGKPMGWMESAQSLSSTLDKIREGSVKLMKTLGSLELEEEAATIKKVLKSLDEAYYILEMSGMTVQKTVPTETPETPAEPPLEAELPFEDEESESEAPPPPAPERVS